MEYIIKSDSYRLLKNQLNELTKDISKENIFYYDLLNDDLGSILEECNYVSIFDDLKCVIVYNSYIFNTKFEYKEELDVLEKYLNRPNDKTILIFLADSISKTKKSVKLIDKKNGVINIKQSDEELKSNIKTYLNDNNYKIENSALNLIIEYQNSNYDFILNELDKIMVVKTDYLINEDDVNKYSIDNREYDIFKFVDVIIKKDIKNISYYLDRFISNNKEPAIILSLMAGQYRFLYSIKSLYNQGYKESDIASIINANVYRVKMSLIEAKNYSIDELKDKILSIGKLDEQIKLGLIDKYIGLKLLLFTL